jgi:hypothetical protein
LIFRKLIFFSLILLFITPISAVETTGWFPHGNEYKLLIEGIAVYDTSQNETINLPSNLTTIQQVEASLYLGEFFIKNKNKQGVATILYQIRLKSSDFRLADAIITTLWKRMQNEEQASRKTLESYIKIENNLYFKSLSKNIYTSLFTEGEDEKKSPEEINCNSKLPYYSICKFFRLQSILDKTSPKANEVSTHYTNIMKVLSPFYEEELLHSLPFLGDLDQDLPPRLAFLGFANEGMNFQRIILESEKAAYGKFSENSLERHSFLQILAGEFSLAENTLKELLILSKNRKGSNKNRIRIKLGVLAYLQGSYKESLDYYLDIDFNEWSSVIVHPILNEPLSIPQAKDLIAVSLWKSQGEKVALQALRQIPSEEKIYQEEVWPRLRIAQILRDTNIGLASKITDEIIYLAQSRGWKRLEYSATILQGYNQIDNELYRKSTIEFTKSRGILSADDQEFASEWLRNTGLVFAHQASGQKSPVVSFIIDALKILKNDPPDDNILTMVHYRPQSFSSDGFIQTSLLALGDGAHAKTIMELIHSYKISSTTLPGIYETGLFQIKSVHNRLKVFSGFQSLRETNFHDSIYNQSRESEVAFLNSEREDFSEKYTDEVKNPALVIFPWKNSLYIFSIAGKNKKKNHWELKYFADAGINSFQIKQTLHEITESLQGEDPIQIFLNLNGLTAYDFLRKDFPNQKFSLFYRFKTNAFEKRPDNLVPVIWSDEISPSNGMKKVDRMSFEGTKILQEPNRVHIWDYENIGKSDRLLDMEWKNSASKETISMKRVIRRMESRTIPTAILVSARNLRESSQLTNQNKIIDWCSFWLRSGTGTVYYRKEIQNFKLQEFYSKYPMGVAYSEDSDVISVNRDLY